MITVIFYSVLNVNIQLIPKPSFMSREREFWEIGHPYLFLDHYSLNIPILHSVFKYRPGYTQYSARDHVIVSMEHLQHLHQGKMKQHRGVFAQLRSIPGWLRSEAGEGESFLCVSPSGKQAQTPWRESFLGMTLTHMRNTHTRAYERSSPWKVTPSKLFLEQWAAEVWQWWTTGVSCLSPGWISWDGAGPRVQHPGRHAQIPRCV